MADRIRVALLWHMHQPCYRNSYDGTTVMPLAFIHATKDYYDMLHLARSGASIRTTFNLVPSLLDQMESYSRPESDVFLQVLLKPAGDLDEDDLSYLYDFLFIGSVAHQIHPLSRYYQLYDRWERTFAPAKVMDLFTAEEILDLQVLFLLAWTGTVIREEEPFVRQLLAKGKGFGETEKRELLDLLLGRVAGIIPAYRQAQESGAVEIVTSPYYHPILPLLLDFESARAVEGKLPLPVTCGGLHQDAPVQVERALERYTGAFGATCKGMWPSEGAVSPQALGLMARNGITWTASDEEVLAHSLGVSPSDFGGRRRDLYRPWKFQTPDGEVAIFFRDRGLSDLIGFTYQRMEAGKAVLHFMGRLHEIRKSLPDNDGVVPVILDGENAWEHYPGNARPFLEQLYEALASDPAIETVTFSQALDRGEPRTLDRLVPGSWIGGRLSTWVGHPEKNRAWELVCRAREGLCHEMAQRDEETREKVHEQLLVAEGSDWYWWFGDDHFTTLADRFDELFRLHVINAYRFADLDVPAELMEPIKRKRARGHLREPTDVLSPVIDGIESSYFEWLSAGRFNLDFDQGSMHLADPVLRELRYGFDDDFLYLRFDTNGEFAGRAAGLTLAIEVVEPLKTTVRFRVAKGSLKPLSEKDRDAGCVGKASRIAEIALPLEALGAFPGRELLLSFGLWKGDDPVERAPLFSLVKIVVPEDYELEYWIV